MKKLLFLGFILFATQQANAALPTRYVQISTNTLTRQTGSSVIAGINVSTATISSATVSGITISTAVISSATISGVTDGSNAEAGKWGEFKSSATSSAGVNSVSSGFYGDILSISLTAGDWDISCVGTVAKNGATIGASAAYQVGISTVAGNSGAGMSLGDNLHSLVPPETAGTISTGSVPTYRLVLTTTTTVYFKYRAEYSSGGPPVWYGRISARRVR